jgi:hypothetical protein
VIVARYVLRAPPPGLSTPVIIEIDLDGGAVVCARDEPVFASPS